MSKWSKIVKKPNPEKEKELRDGIEESGGLDKKDVPAMLLSAYLIIIPIALAVLGIFALVGWLFLGGF